MLAMGTDTQSTFVPANQGMMELGVQARLRAASSAEELSEDWFLTLG